MEGHQHLHHQHHHHLLQQQLQQQQQHSNIVTVNVVDVGDRFPQWSVQETKEMLSIRAELDQSFMETKRNKQLWEVVSNKMNQIGFLRTPEQCKCKWKNLVTRYKGCETMEPEAMRQQFPFYNELQVIFATRMQRMLWAEAEGGGGGGSKTKKPLQTLSSDDEDDNNNEDSNGEHQKGGGGDGGGGSNSKKKKKKGKIIGNYSGNSSGSNNLSNLKEILEDFMRQQMQIEAQWMEVYEARENERRMKEIEWRQTMEALEKEKIMMDQRWREREEQRRVREEARAEKRDALINALLNKFRREEM